MRRGFSLLTQVLIGEIQVSPLVWIFVEEAVVCGGVVSFCEGLLLTLRS